MSVTPSASTAEKFAELESRIVSTVEMVKTLRREKETAEKDLAAAYSRAGRLEQEIEELRSERDSIRSKVESLLDDLSALAEESLV
jgi:chromosome segregation ATPase